MDTFTGVNASGGKFIARAIGTCEAPDIGAFQSTWGLHKAPLVSIFCEMPSIYKGLRSPLCIVPFQRLLSIQGIHKAPRDFKKPPRIWASQSSLYT